MGRYASLNHNIYIAVDPTTVDVEHAAHACNCIVRPQYLFSESWRPASNLLVTIKVSDYLK